MPNPDGIRIKKPHGQVAGARIGAPLGGMLYHYGGCVWQAVKVDSNQWLVFRHSGDGSRQQVGAITKVSEVEAVVTYDGGERELQSVGQGLRWLAHQLGG